MSERQLLIDAGNTRVEWQLREGTALRGEGALCLEAVSTLPEGPGSLFLSSVLRPLRESELLRSLEALGWPCRPQSAGRSFCRSGRCVQCTHRRQPYRGGQARGRQDRARTRAGATGALPEYGWRSGRVGVVLGCLSGTGASYGRCRGSGVAAAGHGIYFRGGSAGHDAVGASSNDCPHWRRRGSASAGTAAAPAWPCGQAGTWTGTRGASRPGRDSLRAPPGLPKLLPAPP